jgi:hypothetical protein
VLVVDDGVVQPHARVGVGVGAVRVLEPGADVGDEAVGAGHGHGDVAEGLHAALVIHAGYGEGAVLDHDALGVRGVWWEW